MDIVVVDDSLMFRSAISTALSEVEGFNVVKKLSNGSAAVDYFRSGNTADAMILDLEMPVLDGISALVEIRKINSEVKIIIFSSLTVKGAEKTLEALRLGANDFVPKVEGTGNLENSLNTITDELVPKLEALVFGHTRATKRITGDFDSSDIKTSSYLDDASLKPNILCIGSSTGGPDALLKVFSEVQNIPRFPILLVQHMPPVFTTKLAASLDKKTAMTVKEAKHGEKLENGVCYVAPGDFHMEIQRKGSDYYIATNKNEKVCHVRPSVDVMLDSVTESFTGKIVTIILTGMGSDGANGCEKLQSKHPHLYIQDKESSVVWGMPGSVFAKKIDAKVLSLSEIGSFVNMISGN